MKEYTVKVADNYIGWYKPGTEILHREDGPALEYVNGNKYWYKKNKLHRLDGPACEYSNGDGKWYIEGEPYTETEFIKKMSKQVDSCDGKVVIIDGKEYKLILI